MPILRISILYLLLLRVALGAPWGICDLHRPKVFQRFSDFIQLQSLEKKIHLVVSFHGIKSITNHLQDGGTAAEHFTSVLHYEFQTRLFDLIDAQTYKQLHLSAIGSPYVKYIQIEIKTPPQDWRGFHDLLLEAKRAATSDVVRYISDPSVPLSFKSGALIHPKTQFKYVIPASESKIPEMKVDRVKVVSESILKKWVGNRELDQFLNSQLGVGVATTDIDAKLVARLGVEFKREFGQDFFFRPEHLLAALKAINRAEANIPWFLNSSDADLQRAFVEVRRNASTDSFSPDYQKILSRGLTDKTEGIFLHRNEQLEEYVRSLNLLDYLPEAFLVEDVSAREAFNQFHHPKVVGYVDVKGLGGLNYYQFHKNVPAIRKATAELIQAGRRLIVAEKANSSSEVIEQLRSESLRSARSLYKLREEILLPSDRYLREIRDVVRSVLHELTGGEFVIWATGDDVFFVLRNTQLSTEDVVKRIKSHPRIFETSRVAAMGITPGTSVANLAVVRDRLGPMAKAHKYVEATNYSDEVVIFSNNWEQNIWSIQNIGPSVSQPNLPGALMTRIAENFGEYRFVE